jgi:hypothetical protein
VVSPGRPVPGGSLMVRYTAAPYFRREPRLVLIGWYSAPGGAEDASRHRPDFDADSLATLIPVAKGVFETRLQLPADFRALHLAVVDSAGNRMDRNGKAMWTIVVGNVDRSPSLDALIAAEESGTWAHSTIDGKGGMAGCASDEPVRSARNQDSDNRRKRACRPPTAFRVVRSAGRQAHSRAAHGGWSMSAD